MVLRHIGGVFGLRRGILRGLRSPGDVGAKPVGVEAKSGGVEANSNGFEAISDGIEAHILITFLDMFMSTRMCWHGLCVRYRAVVRMRSSRPWPSCAWAPEIPLGMLTQTQ